MNTYIQSASHDTFQSMIGYMYAYPVKTAWDYAGIYQVALDRNIRIIAMLDDGVVYQMK